VPHAETHLFTPTKIKFVRPDGTLGESPIYGSVLLGMGARANTILRGLASSGWGWCPQLGAHDEDLDLFRLSRPDWDADDVPAPVA
jgi:hypothetical protein